MASIEKSVINTFETGFGRGFHVPGTKHQVEAIVKEGEHKKELLELKALERVYGFHAPYTRLRELNYLSHCRRLPGTGLKSSLLSLDIMMDRDDTIDFDSFPYIESPVAVSDRLGRHLVVDKQHLA